MRVSCIRSATMTATSETSPKLELQGGEISAGWHDCPVGARGSHATGWHRCWRERQAASRRFGPTHVGRQGDARLRRLGRRRERPRGGANVWIRGRGRGSYPARHATPRPRRRGGGRLSARVLVGALSAVLMDAAPVLATQKRSDRPLEDPGGPCRAWIESHVKGGSYKDFQVRDPILFPSLLIDPRFSFQFSPDPRFSDFIT